MTRRSNKLTNEKRGVLILWLEANQDAFIKQGVTFGSAARRARSALGFQVTRNNVASIALSQSLRWYGSSARPKPKHVWRCSHCGGLCKSKTCQKCKLTRSKLLNAQIAKRHGTQWAKAQHLKGRYLDGRQNKTQPIDTRASYQGRALA